MSTNQSTENELRYLKRKNLKQEQKMVGNWYRDIIRSYGVDVIYQKLDTSSIENYRGVIDRNMVLARAYGQIYDPDYTCSADMITYMEVDQDIFQLQKYGLNPNMDVNFYFDATDFACALATKIGQYEEYKIEETEITCEVPECTDEVLSSYDPDTKELVMTSYLSDNVFPYQLGLGPAENYSCGILSGKLSVEIPGYEFGKKHTVVCDPYQHSDFQVEFPSNDYLYKSLMHRIENDDYLQTMIQLTYSVSKVVVGKDEYGKDITKCILHGKIHGGVLFYNLKKLGKYADTIHPEVGDLVTIDFPDESNREKYEITDCYDKQLTQDGISPLLGTYIWKCKARRYIHSHDGVDMNEKDKQLKEKKKLQRAIDNEIMSHISQYPNGEDAAYGGYDAAEEYYEEQLVDQKKHRKLEYAKDGTVMDIFSFSCGTKLATNGYDLMFVDAEGDAYQLTLSDRPNLIADVFFDGGLRFLKASADALVFTNIAGETFKLAEDEEATEKELQLCLNSLYDKTVDPAEGQTSPKSFFVFKESKTVIWSTEHHLYCKLASNGRLYKLV